MDDGKRIEDLQRRIDELSSTLKDQHRSLSLLQQELYSIQKKEIPHQAIAPQPSESFRLENFLGLRVMHLVGIVVLVIGLSIGVKYAIDRQLISEAMRILFAYAAGIILYALSWRLKKKYQLFSSILFSGAMASLYFTTYASFVYYGFFSFAVTFLLMASFTVYTAYEAIRYERQEIAVLGMVGAYGIPFLISANNGRADLFFSYIFVIDIGIVYLSFKRKWGVMAQFALLISWTLFILWGFSRYQPGDFSTGFPLMILFYLLFTVNALANRIIRSEEVRPGDIQQLVFNNIALYLSGLILFGYGHFGDHLAAVTGYMSVWMALFAALVYLIFRKENVLQQSLAIQAVVLFALFIGFYWTGFMVTVFWILLTVLLFSGGIFTKRSWPRLASILLMSITLGKLVIFDSSKFSTIQKIVAYLVIGTLLLVVSFFYQKFKQNLFGEKSKPERQESIQG